MRELFLTLCTFVIIGVVNCQYYFVTAPNVIRFEHDETVVVSVFGLNNAIVKVGLQYKGKKFSEKEVVVGNEAKPQTTSVRVKESDIFGISVAEDKPRTLQIYSEYEGSTQFRDVVISYQSGYLIVQTDKPIYTPKQTVKIRTLALEESLKPSIKQEVAMEIISPTNLTMARISIPESQSGFFQHEFTLPPYPDVGTWTARAFYKGQFETTARSLFQVEEYVLPTFGVTVDVDVPYILKSTNTIRVTIRAKYVYGKPVEGKVRLQLSLKDKLGSTEYIMDINPALLQNTGDIDGSIKEFSIETAKILNSPLLKDRAFPEGSRLEVIAWVFETATGKEEARSNDNTMFTNNPYRFQFSRSKVNFRPGWEYYLKVDVTFANGKPAENQDVSVHIVENGQLRNTQLKKSGRDGQLVAIFGTSNNNKMTFRASIGEGPEKVESEDFVITPYGGKNQIQVESSTVDGDMMTMRAFTNMDLNGGFTGMLFMVVTRGKVVHTLYEAPSNQKSAVISKKLQEYITPSARLLVFYVDKNTGELVADSVRFDVEQKCQEKLTLGTINPVIAPGKNDQLTVKGSPFMWVGLNAMDKALLLLNDKNVLKKNKMFEALASHDLGCGEGSGKSSGDVFKKSGLTVLTNAVVSNEDLKRDTDTCANMKRKKRDAEDCYGANPVCCEQGSELADRLYDEVVDHEKLDPYTKCYAKARELALQRKLPTKCIMAFFHTCRQELDGLITVVTKISSKSLSDDDDYYNSDLAKLADIGVQPLPRSDFRESWHFELVKLDNEGQFHQSLTYPDSITEWMFQAIGITEENGMCIADPIYVKAYKDFFIQLDLPYKAVRMENLNVKATIFNYGLPDEKKQLAKANVYIEGVEGLCFNTEPGKPSPKIQVDLPPNSAQTVAFPMIPWKAGQFRIKVYAIVAYDNNAVVDIVEKKLLVVNEGIQVKETLQICLDANEDNEDCKNDDRVIENVIIRADVSVRTLTVNLTLPENAISGTGIATGYLQSNIMDNVVTTLLNGVYTLLSQPSGCGEQTMLSLAPTVYALSYLKKTKQINNDIEVKGNKYIKDGIVLEVTQYRHADGAYSAWRHRAASTWLTAFVAKVFCQAKAVVDDAVDDIQLTIKWLTDHVEANGSFVDNMPVIHREMIGQINERDPSLTSFVLLSLLECSVRTPEVEITINKSQNYVEKLDHKMLENNPYILALSTYALAMAKSEKKLEFKTLLEKVSHSDGRDMYWGNPGGRPASASSVETTAYALLAMLKFNDFKSSARIVRWLTSQRDAQGSFRTTQDTVVGLQALSTYSHRTYSPDVNLKVTLVHGATKVDDPPEYPVTKENAVLQTIVRNLPVERGNNRLMVKVQGSGSGRMMIDLRYNRPAKNTEICPFHISDIEVFSVEDSQKDHNLAQDRNCDVCGKCDEPENPDYDLQAFGAPVEQERKIESNFGKRKRRATQSNTCITFRVRSTTNYKHGMSIVNFGLETDVEVVPEDLEKLMKKDPNIARYELPSSGSGFIVFYLNQITPVETKFIFRLKDNYEGNKNTRQPSYIEVYDYYNPDQTCTQIYGTGSNRDIGVECADDNKKQCRCVHSLCAQPIDKEIVELAQKKEQPAIKLIRYTCNPEKANYAVLVTIPKNGVSYDKDTGEGFATGTVQARIHKGIENINTGDEMTFFWKLHCQHTELLEGKQYYIIGKDGHTFKKGNAEEMRYPIMGTTLVIEDKNDKKVVDNVMKAYKKMMEKGCNA